MTSRTRLAAIASLLLIVCAAWWRGDLVARQRARTDSAQGASTERTRSGQTATQLPDGRWLFVGGDGSESSAVIWDPRPDTVRPTAGALHLGRASHTATVLSDGSVLIVGGRTGTSYVEVPELFDPATETFVPVGIRGAAPRASHTATLLTDGRLLVAGGSARSVELWDVQTQSAVTLDGATVARSGHVATLSADGRVRITGGQTQDGGSATQDIVIDPTSGIAERVLPVKADERTLPFVSGSMPSDGAQDVSVDAHFAVRFSAAMAVTTLGPERLVLSGPNGVVTTRVIAADGGRLAFVWPAERLEEGARYTLSVAGVIDEAGTSAPRASILVTTARAATTAPTADAETWMPDPANPDSGWRTNRPQSPWESLAPLEAPPGVTAVSGRVLTLDGRPLPDVALRLEGHSTTTDRTGRFLLVAGGVTVGEHTLAIDSTTASVGQRRYGFYEARIRMKADVTNVLPFTIWSPRLDMVHEVTIPSPTTAETVVSTPTMPGLELHLPAGAVITDEEGHAVRKLTMTPIPLDRTPFPLPTDAMFSMFFTIQPGGAYVKTTGPIAGGWLVYPNHTSMPPGARVQFFNYDPDDKGWFVYGAGTVTGAKVVPDPRTRIYAFTGASFNSGPAAPGGGKTPKGPEKQDPVDPSTGAFIMRKTDLYLPDVMPLAFTRVHNSLDGQARAFGYGTSHAYALFQYSTNQFNDGDLILPDGGRIHYVRISADGLPWYQTVMECQTGPTEFYKSRLFFDGNAWEYVLKDGTVFIMGHQAPLQSIRDKYGNVTRLTWSSTNVFGAGYGNLVRITSPNGRWVEFTYDSAVPVNRVTQAKDNIGRTVTYTYSANGDLATATDVGGNVTTYTYDSSHRILTITDGRNITYLTNTYTSGRVATQTLADPSVTATFAYTVNGSGSITQTDVTNPRGFVERLAFNSDHYVTSDIEAYGTSLARVMTYTRQAGSNLPTAVVDGLGRETDYTFDAAGHVLSVTQLAGTANAVTTSYTYEPIFSQFATLTDSLNHTWTLTYDASGHLSGITDPLTHHTSLTLNATGQMTSVSDPLSHQWQFGYSGADLITSTDPLNAVSSRFVDAAGRVISTTDALGRTTRVAVDNLNRSVTVTDPRGGATSLTYDANSNATSLTDALTHATTYSYDSFDRVSARTDPLSHADARVYDANGNLSQFTDRKSQATSYTYDALDRLSGVTFADASTIAYTYDAGDRVTQIVDSANGTISRTYDGLDHLTEETTPQGTIDYTYDADGRRSTMTISGQPSVSYSYDNAHRLTTITQNSSTVSLTYDDADRRATLTYPNGIVATYGYDAANQLTALTYSLGQTTVGTLTYGYDPAGQRTSVGGSLARTGMPSALTGATYDAANRIVTWAGTTFSYDLNGNQTGDGTNTFSWNARNQLTAVTGGTSASFAYDAVGRRRAKTISSSTNNFLYDDVNVVQEQNAGATANLLTGLSIDETFTRSDVGGTSTLLADALGSTLELADASGTLQTHYTYEPYGAGSASGASNPNTFQFTGRENDGTGLIFLRARYLSVPHGRFISEDPIGTAGGVNTYNYVLNDPVTQTDPSGLFSCSWHMSITISAAIAAGMSMREAMALGSSVCDADKGTQGTSPGEAHQHGMGGRKDGKYETCDEAFNGAADFLRSQIALGNLGSAIHLIEDQWAAGHRYAPWGGRFHWPAGTSPGRHVYGDIAPNQQVIDEATKNALRFLNDFLAGNIDDAGHYLHNFCG